MGLIDFILHIDDHLVTIVNMFGNWTYLILFAIVFIFERENGIGFIATMRSNAIIRKDTQILK